MSSLNNMYAEKEFCSDKNILHEVFCNIDERHVLCVMKSAKYGKELCL